jgi:hypothetical protein
MWLIVTLFTSSKLMMIQLHRFHTIDIIARLIFIAIVLIVGVICFMFLFNREYLFELIVDIFYSAKYLLSNYLVVPRSVSKS